MPIIRKKLSVDEVGVKGYRYNATTDTVEVQLPDLSWVDAPTTSDPRVTNVVPPRTGGDPQCDAAANMAIWIDNYITSVVNSITLGVGAFGIAGTTLGLIGTAAGVLTAGFGLLWVIAVDLGLALIAQGAGTISAAFTPEVIDTLKCIFYNNMGDDGFIDATQLTQIEADIDTEIGGVVAIVLHAMIALMGFAGLNTQGAVGADAGDCDDCDDIWCEEIDLTLSDGGFVTLGGLSWGVWNDPLGWIATYGGESSRGVIYIGLTLPAGTLLTEVQMFYNKDVGSGGNNVNQLWAKLGGSNVFGSSSNTLGMDLWKQILSSPTEIDQIYIDMNTGGSTISTSDQVLVSKILLAGTGTPPGIGVSC